MLLEYFQRFYDKISKIKNNQKDKKKEIKPILKLYILEL